MLVFDRKRGEKILIGDDIVITIVQTGSTRVRIGIDAPREIPVHRAEVYDPEKPDVESL